MKKAEMLRDKFESRFKLMMLCKNIADFNLPSFISSYNAKPVLLRNVIITSPKI